MPELPEVENARRLLQKMCCGKVIKSVEVVQDEKVFDGTLDGACPDDFVKRLSGASVTKASRKGKQLWLEFGSRPGILFHLGMTGSFAAIHPDGTQESAEYVNTKVDMKLWPPKHWKLHFEMEGGGKIAFIAVRRFERIRMVQNPEKEPPVSLLGFDPLYEMPPLKDFIRLLKAKRGPIKGVLLDQLASCSLICKAFCSPPRFGESDIGALQSFPDIGALQSFPDIGALQSFPDIGALQSFSAGVGNWVADEVLYQAKLHPAASVDALSPAQIESVWNSLSSVIQVACDVSADSSRFPSDWLFHYRWTGKKECTMSNGHAVKFCTVASRTTAWVPSVQKMLPSLGVKVQNAATQSPNPKAPTYASVKSKANKEESVTMMGQAKNGGRLKHTSATTCKEQDTKRNLRRAREKEEIQADSRAIFRRRTNKEK